MDDMITRFDALQAKPEFLSKNLDDNITQNYIKGWNSAIEEYISNLKDTKITPSIDTISTEDYTDIKTKLAELQNALDKANDKFSYLGYPEYYYNLSYGKHYIEILAKCKYIDEMKPCPKCGHFIFGNFRFCPNCGEKIPEDQD